MKTMATLATLVAMSLGASAATINWGFGGDVFITEDGTSSSLSTGYTPSTGFEVPTSGYLALVYLGQNVTETGWDIGSITDSSVVDTFDYAVDSSGWWTPETKATQIRSTAGYANGATFAIVWNNGTSFDYVYGVDYDSGVVGDAVKDVITITDIDVGGASAYAIGNNDSGAIHAAVPEPSVALMGLLGLGMLLKRRRA